MLAKQMTRMPRTATSVANAAAGRRFVTRFSLTPNAEKAAEFRQFEQHSKEHAAKSSKWWKTICIVVCVPALAASGINSYFVEKAHMEHRHHMTEEDLPKDYVFRNMRTHKYFWGDGSKTIFWNDDVNYMKSDQ